MTQKQHWALTCAVLQSTSSPSCGIASLRRLTFGITLAALTLGPLANAQEWTRFRGPNGSGLGKAPNLPAEFSEKDYNWKIELAGTGHSSPVIWGDRIFVTATPKGTARRIIACLNAADGKVLWQKEFDTSAYHLHADNNYSAGSAAVDAERVYLHWAAPEGSGLVALDQKDGHEIWKKELGPYVSQHGPGSSPIVWEEMVIVSFDQDEPTSFLLAVDAKTGAQRWKLERPGTSHSASTPCIYSPKTGSAQAILTSRTNGMTAVDVNKGTIAWELPGLMTKRCVASPFVTPAGIVIGQCGEGRSESFVYAVQPGADGKSAQKLYEVVRSGGYVPTPIAVNDFLFLWKEDGLVTCLREATKEQLWSERVSGPYYGSPVSVNGRLYNMTVRGDLVVLAAGDKFQQIARIPLGEGTEATPAVSGGRMYLRTASHLISVGK
ncbi:MAG: hypothetical protein JWL90_1989 [Chthoniobacteraceae bacterium]|nr:hypothetical protein [Chthoniobacteraceae bacterium]